MHFMLSMFLFMNICSSGNVVRVLEKIVAHTTEHQGAGDRLLDVRLQDPEQRAEYELVKLIDAYKTWKEVVDILDACPASYEVKKEGLKPIEVSETRKTVREMDRHGKVTYVSKQGGRDEKADSNLADL